MSDSSAGVDQTASASLTKHGPPPEIEVVPHAAPDGPDSAPFAPEAELTVLLPERSVPLTEDRRDLVKTLLWLADTEGVVTRIDEQHAISSLRVPLDARKLHNLDHAMQILGLREPTATSSESGIKKKHRVARFFDWAGGELKTWWPLVGAVIGTVFVLFPALKPSQPPESRGVTVSNVAVESWASSYGNGSAVDVISYDVSFEGYRGESIGIEWAAFDASTKLRVQLGSSSQNGLIASTGSTQRLHNPLKASASADRGTATFPIPLPFQSECIFIRVYARVKTDSDGKSAAGNGSTETSSVEAQRLDYADSPPFNTHSANDPSCPPPHPAAAVTPTILAVASS